MDKVICTVCPMSCEVQVYSEKGKVIRCENYKCKRGLNYAIKEFEAPERTLTTTVRIRGGVHPLLPVRTDRPVPKEALMRLMQQTAKLQVQAPVAVGQVLVEDVGGTGANLIASRRM